VGGIISPKGWSCSGPKILDVWSAIRKESRIVTCGSVPRSRFLGPNFRVAVTRAVYTVIPIANALALFYDCFFTRPLHIETARAKENLCRKDLEPHRNHA
jgi:hypothetical protein